MLTIAYLMTVLHVSMCTYGNNNSMDFFEGDIKGLSFDTIKQRLQKDLELSNKSNIQLAARRGLVYRWIKGRVPYTFKESYPSLFRMKVEQAMQIFHNKTCIQFVPRKGEVDYIEIAEDNDFCYSFVGRQGGKQIVSLPERCTDKNIILHELMHTLGFFHEHNRADRDNYIIVDFSMIPERFHRDFEKHNLSITTHYNTLYDYHSVMHYSPFMDGVRIIQPKFFGVVIKADGLSYIDVWEINKHYGCAVQDEIEPELKIEPMLTECHPGEFYCGHELKKLNYQSVNSSSLYQCNDDKEAVLFTKCIWNCIRLSNTAHCGCKNESSHLHNLTNSTNLLAKRSFCGYELKSFNYYQGIDDQQPYKCENMSLVRYGSKCRKSKPCLRGICQLRIYGCRDGVKYCGKQLVQLGFDKLGGIEITNILYNCTNKFSVLPLENCTNGCMFAANNSHCSMDKSLVAISSL